MKKVTSVMVSIFLSVLLIGMVLVFQIRSLISKEKIQKRFQEVSYVELFQAIPHNGGTLYDTISNKLEQYPMLSFDVDTLLKSEFMHHLLDEVIQKREKGSFDMRLSKSEIQTFLISKQELLSRELHVTWNDATQQIVTGILSDVIYHIISQIPEEFYDGFSQIDEIDSYVNQDVVWLLATLIGTLVITLALLQPSKKFFLYLLLPITLVLGYGIIFTNFLEETIMVVTTDQLRFMLLILEPYIQNTISLTKQVGMVAFVTGIVLGILYILLYLKDKKIFSKSENI